MRCPALSTIAEVAACEYPDSRKIVVVAGSCKQRSLRGMLRAENTVDDHDREQAQDLPSAPADPG
jgi:hypothetical protein